MAGDVKLIIDGAALEWLLNSPAGPVGIHMIEQGEIVKQAAKTLVRQMTETHTGCLDASIVKRFATDGRGLTIIIQSDTSPCAEDHKSYSMFVHEGTPPHMIYPRNASVLAFMWHGQMAFFSSVHHPGTAPRPFLRLALEALRG
jgi:hypothetical protein